MNKDECSWSSWDIHTFFLVIFCVWSVFEEREKENEFVVTWLGIFWRVNSDWWIVLLPLIGQCFYTAKVGLKPENLDKNALKMGWTKLGLKKDE